MPRTAGRRRYGRLYALWVVIVLLVVAVMPADVFGAPSGTFTDVTLRGKGPGTRGVVVPHAGALDPESLGEFPSTLDRWRMTRDYRSDFLLEFLAADRVVSRDYRAPGALAPMSLVLVASDHVSSFHPPRVCYAAQRYHVHEDRTGLVLVPIGKDGNVSLYAERLVAERVRANGITDRHMVLHYFLKEEQGRFVERGTWVRASTFILPGSDGAAEEAELLEFLSVVTGELVRPASSAELYPEPLLDRLLQR